MTDPRYQDIPSSAIPEVTEDDGTKARIICGEFWGKTGPVEGVAAGQYSVDARYVDISVPPFKRKRIQVETTRNAFAYVFAGAGTFRDASAPQAVLTESAVDPNAQPVYDAKNHSLVLFDRGDEIVVQAGPEGIRFLLVSGKPLEEPVAWYGPIVMNTQDELRQAMAELHDGSFHPPRISQAAPLPAESPHLYVTATLRSMRSATGPQCDSKEADRIPVRRVAELSPPPRS